MLSDTENRPVKVCLSEFMNEHKSRWRNYVAVQKKLLNLSFTIWKSNEEYNSMHYANNVKELESEAKKIVPASWTTEGVSAFKLILLQ